jgi:hypothetical protein
MNGLKLIGQVILYFLKAITYGWILAAIAVVKRFIKAIKDRCAWAKLPHPVRNGWAKCSPIRHPSFHRPDPCIYDQYYLMQLGLPVTWDNPDITVWKNGVQVPQHSLLPSTEYEVQAQIWNNSYEAPVVGMPVQFSYLSFGVGTTSTPIGQTLVNVGVKGGPDYPALTRVPWITPSTPGHYCLQVKFTWFDDANPNNNLGQSNTDVVPAQSPAHFTFQLRNAFKKAARYTFKIDTYTPLPIPDCAKASLPTDTQAARIRAVVARYQSMNFNIPTGWNVAVTPEAVELTPGQEVTIQVDASPPPGFNGQQSFNVNAFADGIFAGGVTLAATKI